MENWLSAKPNQASHMLQAAFATIDLLLDQVHDAGTLCLYFSLHAKMFCKHFPDHEAFPSFLHVVKHQQHQTKYLYFDVYKFSIEGKVLFIVNACIKGHIQPDGSKYPCMPAFRWASQDDMKQLLKDLKTICAQSEALSDLSVFVNSMFPLQ